MLIPIISSVSHRQVSVSEESLQGKSCRCWQLDTKSWVVWGRCQEGAGHQ